MGRKSIENAIGIDFIRRRNILRCQGVVVNMKTIAVVTVLVTGCSPGLRGDGTLAVLVISDKLHEMRYQATDVTYSDVNGTRTIHQDAGDMVDAFCAGAHLWDVVGARVRCAREANGQQATSSVGVVLAEQWENPGNAAWWNSTDGKIHFATMQWLDAPSANAAAAHEIGHALGLDHLDTGNLMTADIESDHLTQEDKAQFYRHWPKL
jgi:hypothetical protein